MAQQLLVPSGKNGISKVVTTESSILWDKTSCESLLNGKRHSQITHTCTYSEISFGKSSKLHIHTISYVYMFQIQKEATCTNMTCEAKVSQLESLVLAQLSAFTSYDAEI